MKTLLTLALVLLSFTALFSQSNLIKGGASYRNTNFLSHTGNQTVGWQLGYRHEFAQKLALEVNFGKGSNSWDIERGGVLVFTEKEQVDYLEAIAFIPLLRKWIPSGNLKGGLGYVGSKNSFEYPEMAIIDGNELSSRTEASTNYFLHDLGLFLDYKHPISGSLVAYASAGLSASLNPAPSYSSTIVEYHEQGGTSTHFSAIDERNVLHYRFSFGLGYSL